jgi:hypothetical protein
VGKNFVNEINGENDYGVKICKVSEKRLRSVIRVEVEFFQIFAFEVTFDSSLLLQASGWES